MRERDRDKAGITNVQIVRERDARFAAILKKRRVLASPLGGLQIIAAHLNELSGQRAQLIESDCPSHIKDEVDAWEKAEHIVMQPLAQAVELFNTEASRLPMLVQVELVQGERGPPRVDQQIHLLGSAQLQLLALQLLYPGRRYLLLSCSPSA